MAIVLVNLIGGVDYDEIADSARNVLLGIVVPVAVASALVAALATYFGWWREIMVERPAGRPWSLIVPGIFALGIVGGLFGVPFGDWATGTILLLALGTLLVGFGEELTTRGVLLVGMRARYREILVWLITSGLFALMHGLNIISGQAVGKTLVQVVFTFVIGSVLYASRRATGLLIVPMILHALWDFTLLTGQGPGAGTAQEATQGQAALIVAMYLAAAAAVVFLVRVVRKEKPEPPTP
ncbi:MAG: CPBP family intramembrane glutamic endopeptidase [Solirubrobacterales bacterium]